MLTSCLLTCGVVAGPEGLGETRHVDVDWSPKRSKGRLKVTGLSGSCV
jgi:hypothetical protein